MSQSILAGQSLRLKTPGSILTRNILFLDLPMNVAANSSATSVPKKTESESKLQQTSVSKAVKKS